MENGRRGATCLQPLPHSLYSLAVLTLLCSSSPNSLHRRRLRFSDPEMAASALASRALQPPHGHHPAAPPPRARSSIAATRRRRRVAAASARCRAVAADERPADPAFPEGQNGGLSG